MVDVDIIERVSSLPLLSSKAIVLQDLAKNNPSRARRRHAGSSMAEPDWRRAPGWSSHGDTAFQRPRHTGRNCLVSGKWLG